MSTQLSEIRGRHAGADIYLIASGKSMDHVDPAFFEGKVTVGVNQSFRRVPPSYVVVHNAFFYEECYLWAAENNVPLLTVKYGFMNPRRRIRQVPPPVDTPPPVYLFDCRYPIECDGMDLSVVGTDEIVGGRSTLLTGIHICAYLGAKNVILCGADGGLLDGESHFVGYREGNATPNIDNFPAWLRTVEPQVIALRRRLYEVYGCRVYSLNPFVNFGLEGHQYRRG